MNDQSSHEKNNPAGDNATKYLTSPPQKCNSDLK